MDQTKITATQRETRTFTQTEGSRSYSSDAYTEDGADTWRWTTNDAYCPLDACKDHGIPCDVAKQTAARDAQLDASAADYRRRMVNHVPDAEEMFEMRAAFGEGTTVVNVLTGRRTRL